MAADKEFAVKQLERFASYPGAPDTALELNERAEFLADLSENNGRCQTIADRLMRTVRFFPLPVDMEQAAEYYVPEEYGQEAPPCMSCGGTGWVHCVPRDERGYSYAYRCSCMTRKATESAHA